MNNDTSGMECFPPPHRHAYLDADAVKRLVSSVEAGFRHPANLERARGVWRLRVKFKLADGRTTRRSVTLPDDETAKWVGQYLENARQKALKRKSAERERCIGAPFPVDDAAGTTAQAQVAINREEREC